MRFLHVFVFIISFFFGKHKMQKKMGSGAASIFAGFR